MALALDEYDAPGQQPVECCVHDLSVFEGCEEVESTEVIIGNVGDRCKFSRPASLAKSFPVCHCTSS